MFGFRWEYYACSDSCGLSSLSRSPDLGSDRFVWIIRFQLDIVKKPNKSSPYGSPALITTGNEFWWRRPQSNHVIGN